ncbi:DUF2550 domain-containing protein [Nocardioides sp.]|uniref:DUF2550 domain-containing protein n=1 Tax=Nocardioides sp. TaxID=35761 RepID=UPI00356A7C8A
MPLWQWLLDAVGLLLVLVLLYGAGLVLRRRLLARGSGAFELSYRPRSSEPGRGWVLGLGRYSGDHLEWFRIFSLAPRPKRSWERSRMSYLARRNPEQVERHVLYPGHVVISCGTPEGEVELALSAESLTGLQAWLESRTPGTDWSR